MVVRKSVMVHTNDCEPSAALLSEATQKSTCPKISQLVMQQLECMVRYDCPTKKIRKFIIDHHLSNLKRDASSIWNLKFRVRKAMKEGTIYSIT